MTPHRVQAKLLQGLNLVVADEDEINLELLSVLLRGWGAKVTSFSNGSQALKQSPQNTDGILLSSKLTDCDAFSACRKLRAKACFAAVPVLLMSNSNSVQQQRQMQEAGIHALVVKPIQPDQLRRVLAERLSLTGDKLEAMGEAVADLAELPSIAGINLNEALYRCSNNIELLQKMLQRFSHNYSDIKSRFQQAESEPDKMAACRFAHTLKGAASSISAEAVATSALALEVAYRNKAKQQHIDRLLNDLDEKIQLLLPAIYSMTAQSKIRALPLTNIEALEPAQALRYLLQATENAETESLLMIEQLLNHSAMAKWHNQLARVQEDLESFDFEPAEEKIRSLINQLDGWS